MNALLTDNYIDAVRPPRAPDAGGETAVQLGIWLSGLESFLSGSYDAPFSAVRTGGPADRLREVELVNSALRRCILLAARLLTQSPFIEQAPGNGLHDLAAILRDGLVVGEAIVASEKAGRSEWLAWSGSLESQLVASPAFGSLVASAEAAGDTFLPPALQTLAAGSRPADEQHAELALALPRFGRILKWLSVIGGMLKADEPLKPALVIFSKVNEQILELTTYINGRVERFPGQDAEIVETLDAAAYTASIELKKVFSQELSGLASVRATPSVYARMETAHSLLNDGFQQILAGFARVLDETTDVTTLFPAFRTKLEQSLLLRSELRSLVRLVEAAERNPEDTEIQAMQSAVKSLMEGPVRYLFYKDAETVERFVEEINATGQDKDLVPILHRFAAYLETLFSQVSLRAVLAEHPFNDRPGEALP